MLRFWFSALPAKPEEGEGRQGRHVFTRDKSLSHPSREHTFCQEARNVDLAASAFGDSFGHQALRLRTTGGHPKREFSVSGWTAWPAGSSRDRRTSKLHQGEGPKYRIVKHHSCLDNRLVAVQL